MKDRLEKFVSQNREKFDDEDPKERVWKRISRTLDEKSSSSYMNLIWKVAAVFFFGVTCFLLFQNVKNRTYDNLRERNMAEAKTEFTQVEEYYTSLINNKQLELDSFDDKDTDYRSDLGNLDAMYQVLKSNLDSNPSKEVIDALILNLISRMDILNRELEKLNDQSQSPELGS